MITELAHYSVKNENIPIRGGKNQQPFLYLKKFGKQSEKDHIFLLR